MPTNNDRNTYNRPKRTPGIYWTPMGGNNQHGIWGSSYLYDSTYMNDGKLVTDRIIVDAGRYEDKAHFIKQDVDAIIPDLRDSLYRSKAVFLTHAHTDHIASLVYYAMMDFNLPPIYASKETIDMLKSDFVNYGVSLDKLPKVTELKSGDTVEIGKTKVKAVAVSHSIPGCMGFFINNEHANVFHSGDMKLDNTSVLGKGTDMKSIAEFSKNGVDAMVFDATVASVKGFARKESDICDSYINIINKNKGRPIVIVPSAGHLDRIATIVKAVHECGRGSILAGGLVQYEHVASLYRTGLGFKNTVSKDVRCHMLGSHKSKLLDKNDAVYITSGLYGESGSMIDRAVDGLEPDFNIDKNSLVIFPTNGEDKSEARIANMVDKIRAKGIEVVTGRNYSGLYGSGHAQEGDFYAIYAAVSPKTVIPTHASLKIAEKFINSMREKFISTVDNAPENGDTYKVDSRGVSLYNRVYKRWLGVKKDNNGKYTLVHMEKKARTSHKNEPTSGSVKSVINALNENRAKKTKFLRTFKKFGRS